MASVELTFTLITKPLVYVVGVVVNVNVEPPLLLAATMLPLAVDDTLKSLASPVVAPPAPLTPIVHVMALPYRCGDPDTHDSVDAVVGVPYTTIVCAPFVTFAPPTSTLMLYTLLLLLGVVVNVYMLPLFTLTSELTPLLALTAKSLLTPVDAPTPSFTLIVHVIALPARCGDLLTHASVDAVVGVP